MRRRTRTMKGRLGGCRHALLTRVLATVLAFGSVATGNLARAWADEIDDVPPINASVDVAEPAPVEDSAPGDSAAAPATGTGGGDVIEPVLEVPANQAPSTGAPEVGEQSGLWSTPALGAARAGVGSPEFSITGQLLGKQVAPGSTETAVCVSQQHTDVNPTTTSATLNILVPAGDYAVLTFTLPASWTPNSYTYTVYYKGFQPELIIDGVATEVVGLFAGEELTVFQATVLVVPEGQSVPTDYYPAGQSQLASTTGIAVVRVPADTAMSLDMSMDLFNTNDLGGEAQLPAVTMTASSDFYTGSNGRVTTASDSIAIPPFVRIDKNQWWISEWQTCERVPNSEPTTPIAVNPTISKAFEPALIQPGETATLTVTIANNSAGTATGAWSFTDQFPSVDLSGDPNTPVALRLASAPNWTTTGCTISSYSANPSSNIVAAAGSITPGQAACVITAQVIADASGAANYSANHNLGYFDPFSKNFAFPIDLTNSIDAAEAPNVGLAGLATGTLRVDVPNLKVDVSPPTFTGNTISSITAAWTITVVNASNMTQSGQFTQDPPAELVSALDVVVTSKLNAGLADLVWSLPAGTTGTTSVVAGLPQGTWSIPRVEAGQFFQATLTARVPDPASLASLNVVGTTATVNSGQALVNEVQATMGALPNPAVTLLRNEQPNDATLTELAASWAAPHNYAMPTDTYRIASVEADSDRWDQEATELNAAISISAAPQSSRITGVGPIQITYTVTNLQAAPLNNVVITDPLLGGVICSLSDLAPNATDSCLGSYNVTALEIKERTREKPPDSDEGIWWDAVAGQAFLHLLGTVAANVAYQNPATSTNPVGSTWTIPEPTPGNFTVRSGTAIQIPLLTPGDLGGWLVLPFTGRSGPETASVRDLVVFTAELMLLAALSRWIFASDQARHRSNTRLVRDHRA